MGKLTQGDGRHPAWRMSSDTRTTSLSLAHFAHLIDLPASDVHATGCSGWPNMDDVARRSHVRLVFRLVAPLVVVVALVIGAPLGIISAQVDPQVRDRVVPAIV